MPFIGNVLTALHARYAGQVDRVIAGRILDARLAETAFFGCESASVRGLSPLGTSAAARWLGRHRFLSVGVEFKIDPVKAPRAAPGPDAAAVEWNWRGVRRDRERFG